MATLAKGMSNDFDVELVSKIVLSKQSGLEVVADGMEFGPGLLLPQDLSWILVLPGARHVAGPFEPAPASESVHQPRWQFHRVWYGKWS